jgi:O-acetyl-ADP-ribose deacetylase (regulator of RNase III)
MISFTEGDLFASGLPAIAHGVNCRGVMGAGIAVQFRKRYPKMFESYRRRCLRGEMLPGEILPWQHSDGTVVFNLATQKLPGPHAEPWMITAAAGQMITEAHHDFRITEIGMPLIGCGLGGLTENDLRRCLLPYADAPVSLTVFVLPYTDVVAV